ncbi:MAG TPA: hypothetical protein VFJ18_04665 [Pararhizobium sp.]|nr:hypothetical protein [Pararhizobium sp.]
MLATIESIAKIIGVSVACFGVFTYYDSLQQSKIDKSVAYFDEYHSGRVFEARVAVGSLSYEWLGVRNPDGTRLSKDQYVGIVLEDLSKARNRVEVDIVLEFFDRAQACVESGACDQSTAVKLLHPVAVDFRPYVAPLLDQKKASPRPFAAGLECFAESSSGFCSAEEGTFSSADEFAAFLTRFVQGSTAPDDGR